MSQQKQCFNIKVNETNFELDVEGLQEKDIAQIRPDEYHILENNTSYKIRIIDSHPNFKKQTVEVNGELFVVDIKDPLDLILEKMGFNAVSNKRLKEIKAPMPGLVLDVAVTEGQQVTKGDKILILEAMKMENSILIPNDATIKSILVKAGQSVEKGQIMVELD